MKTYLAWLKEVTDQSGPDIDSIVVESNGRVTLNVSIRSARALEIAQEFADAGREVRMLDGFEEDRIRAHATQGGCGHTCDDDCRSYGCSYDGAPDGVF
jgi:hypothetical protein